MFTPHVGGIVMKRLPIAAIAVAGLMLGAPVIAQQAGPGPDNKPSAERGPLYGPGGPRGYGWGPGMMMGWSGGGMMCDPRAGGFAGRGMGRCERRVCPQGGEGAG